MKFSSLLFALTISLVPACDRSASPTAPISPTAPSPPTAPTPSPAGFRVSGRVFEATGSDFSSVAGGGIRFWLDDTFGGRVDVDANGRFAVTGLPPGRLLRLTWTGWGATSGLHQLSPVNVRVEGDSERDVEVARLNSREFACGSPSLTGIVFEMTDHRRRPLADTRVVYTIPGLAGFDVDTRTDAQGHYTLCQLPQGVGRLGAGDCNDAVLAQPVEVNGDTSFDVDLTAFYASCPGVRP